MIEDLYEEIKSRSINVKEGSYTNYLLEQGLDKILKKVGEEATEVVIAAKNDSKEEVIAETSDLLYHVLVLLVEKGISYQAIEEELKKRQGKMSRIGERKAVKDL